MKTVPTLIKNFRDRQRININLSKGIAGQASLCINPSDPLSWEFSGFSQNGEDGILQYLLQNARQVNRYFLEIGSADGIDNNSAWLAIVKKYNGLMVEGNPELCSRAKEMVENYSLGLSILNTFVNKLTIDKILQNLKYEAPDLISVDIDGMDYYIVEHILRNNFHPKIFLVEYNSVFGPNKCVTVPYNAEFSMQKAHHTELYYGASIQCWVKLFESYGYKFVTVESKGVNAFFVNPLYFDEEFLSNIEGCAYRENVFQSEKYNLSQAELFELIADMEFENLML